MPPAQLHQSPPHCLMEGHVCTAGLTGEWGCSLPGGRGQRERPALWSGEGRGQSGRTYCLTSCAHLWGMWCACGFSLSPQSPSVLMEDGSNGRQCGARVSAVVLSTEEGHAKQLGPRLSPLLSLEPPSGSLWSEIRVALEGAWEWCSQHLPHCETPQGARRAWGVQSSLCTIPSGNKGQACLHWGLHAGR